MMYTKVHTKFIVASEQGIRDLLLLAQTTTREDLAGLLPEKAIEQYITERFRQQAVINEVNSLSNQWMIVYADNQPAGYALVSSRGKTNAIAASRRSIHLVHFEILLKYQQPEIRDTLFEKVLTICTGYEAIWINVLAGHTMIGFLVTKGFKQQGDTTDWNGLSIPAVTLVREQTLAS